MCVYVSGTEKQYGRVETYPQTFLGPSATTNEEAAVYSFVLLLAPDRLVSACVVLLPLL